MIDRSLRASRHTLFSRIWLVNFWPSATLFMIATAGLAALATIILLGPTTMATMSRLWVLGFLAFLAATTLWWVGYLWLLHRLAGWDWQQCLRKSTALLIVLSLTNLPDIVVFLSGILPYTFVFNSDARSLYISLTLGVLGAMVLGQELALVHAARRGGLGGLAAEIWRYIRQLPGRLAGLPRTIPRLARSHPLLLGIIAIGTVQRLVDLDSFHGGDMNVMLSVTFSILTPPPFDYYHDYRPQPWVYNHFPLFPFLLAPSYWVFENIFHWPTVWAAKMQAGIADIALAILLYKSARGMWRKVLGSMLAAAWFLPPWVVTADDHAVGMTATFVVASIAALERGWLSGMLLALGLATRNEAAFFLFPLAVHFVTQRRLSQTVAFFGTFATTLTVLVAPFILTDPEAIDYALRKHTENIGSEQVSALLTLIQSHLDPGFATLLQQKPEILAIGFNLLIALLALRDPRPERVLIVAAAGYILTLPVVHQRYIVFLCSLGLFYAARFRAPVVAVLIVMATWPGFAYGPYTMNVLFIALIIIGLLRLGKPNPMVSLNQT